MISVSQTCRLVSVGRRQKLKLWWSSSMMEQSFTSSPTRRTNTRKRRRPSSLKPTKKDFLRSTTESNGLPKSKHINSTKVAEQIEGRLKQMRQYLQDAGTAISSSLSSNNDSILRSRPPRVGPTMNREWFAWNIAISLVPAVLLGLYCEFIGKPEMEEYYANFEQVQKARMLVGGDDDDVPNATQYGEKDGSEEQHSMIWTGIDKSRAAISRRSTSHPETSSTNTSGSTKGTPASTKELLDDDKDDAISALHRRLELLESQLRQDKTTGPQQQQQQRQARYQLQRTRQSGIQNRIEDRIMNQWQSLDEIEESTLSDKMAEAVRIRLMQSLEATKDAMKKTMVSWKDTLMGESSKETTDTTSTEVKTAAPSRPALSEATVTSAVEEAAAATHRAADIIRSSSSSTRSTDAAKLSEAASKAAVAASDAAAAAERAADSVNLGLSRHPSDTKNDGPMRRTWKRWFGKGQGNKGDEEPSNP